MFNLFSKLPFLGTDAADEIVEMTTEEAEAQAKKDRIEFHRTKVRCGPVNWKHMTNGQVRRAQKREMDRQTKKAWRAEKRNYFERQRVAAYLRGHLQTVGLIPFIDGHTASLDDQIASTVLINRLYGTEVILDGEPAGYVSFERTDVLNALKSAAKFYGSTTGYLITVPADFEPAIILASETAI